MAKKYEVESYNYTDTTILIDAMKEHLNKEGKPGKYAIELLLKLERNKRVLYDIPSTNEIQHVQSGIRG